MDDASSDFSDWEVLSAASAAGGDDDDDVVLVSGQAGHVLHDHFATDPSPPAAKASWPEAASEAESGSRSPGRFGSISPEPTDLIAGAQQPRLGGADVTVTAQDPVLGASLARGGATWSVQEEQTEEALAGAGGEPAGRSGEPDSIPAHNGISGSDAAAVDGLGLHTENSSVQLQDSTSVQLQDSSVQLEDGGADPITESSGLETAATGDAVHAAPEEPEQGEDASAASGCGESDGDEKDRSSPLVAAAAPVTGEGERQVVVWWRLPFRLIHYCAWKVRPVWSISIAAAFLGMLVLGRRMYRMRRKARGLPQIKIAFDDKRASQFADRAARLNEAFLIAKRVPALRTSSGAALPWSMMQER